MTKFKNVFAVLTGVLVIGAAAAAFAAEVKSPQDIAAQLTGKSAEHLSQERAAGKTYGAIAKENGKLEEFKTQMLEQKKAALDQRVKDGSITKEKAAQIYNTLKENSATCDETGQGIGRKNGAGFGMGRGQGGCGNSYGMSLGRGISR